LSSSKYRPTLVAAFAGYIVQAVVVNFAPLLFVTFQTSYGVSLSQLSFLITLTFSIQLVGDITLPRFIHKIGVRTCIVSANALAASGLVLMSFLPDVCSNSFVGILLSVIVYSLGASLIEVLISPIVEACPFENKSGVMSLLHSFYSWGSALTILVTTVFFFLFGVENWKYMSLLWATVPVIDGILFLRAPLAELAGDEKGHETGVLSLLKKPLVWLLLLLMVTAAAAELAVAQWASAFAERGLGISKTLGDLCGPLFFGVLMGIGRVFYARFSDRLNLEKFMLTCGLLTIVSYLMVSLSPWPVLAILGCGLTGFGTGILWPGTLSIGAKRVPMGGTALFALLACFGDLGCTVGPSVVGFVSDRLGGSLENGILLATVFPVVFVLGVLVLMRKKRSE